MFNYITTGKKKKNEKKTAGSWRTQRRHLAATRHNKQPAKVVIISRQLIINLCIIQKAKE